MGRMRVFFLLLTDIISICLSYVLAFYIKFDEFTYALEIKRFYFYLFIIVLIKIITLYFFKLYKSIWEYASIDEMIEIIFGIVAANVLAMLFLIFLDVAVPRTINFIVLFLDMAFIGSTRFSHRIYNRIKNRIIGNKTPRKVLIVGAGAAGVMVLKELRNHDYLRSKSISFIDDDPLKLGKHINRVPVIGNRHDIVKLCKEYNFNEIIIAIPSAKPSEIKSILDECKKTNCKTRIVPGVYELIDGKVNVSKIRDVQIEDLLGRDEVKLDLEGLSSFIGGKRVLVTGGGGSIGSELCRQIARFNPSELIILDIYENSVYDIQNELLKKYKDLNLTIFIDSVRDKERIEEIFNERKPQIVFHAAAHKHVPLMENNPKSAVKNNIFGTLNLVQAADKYGVERFVLISTDKAVNPTNVMGATKRVCEMIIQTYNERSKTEYVAVRFGNVLGSNGSVIPLFKKQIAEGGPVTVTHEEVIRYFMTIPEACQLVLQAGSMAKGGEIFVLDMGEPVKIIDLARDLIKLSGLEPDVDIKIEITGLRPGEKLYEELLIIKENMIDTSHNKIFIEKPMKFNYDELMGHIEYLRFLIKGDNPMEIKRYLAKMVPTYKPYELVEYEEAYEEAVTEYNYDTLSEVVVSLDYSQ